MTSIQAMREARRPKLEESRWIRDYDDGQEVLRSGDFANSLGNGVNHPISADIVLVLTGDEHLSRRRTEIVLFNRRLQETYEFELVEPAVEELLAAATAGTDDWAHVDMLAISRAAMVRVSAKVIGLDGIDTAETALDLLTLSHDIGESFGIDFSTRPADEVMTAAMSANQLFVDRYFAHSLQRRRDALAAAARGEDVEVPEDLLTLLLKQYPDWDDDMLRRECTFFLQASAGTSTHLVPHVILNIARYMDANPEKLSLAQNLSFLQRTVIESLRLEPPQPALFRFAMKDVTLSSGTSFKAGEFFLVDLNAMNRNEDIVGPKPDEFDPYRELAPRIPRFVASFGNGPHLCPGRLVAVGQGNGEVEDEGKVSGAITRLCQSLFEYDVRIDNEHPPTYRTDTRSHRYGAFNILVRRRRPGGTPFITAKD